MKFVFLIKFSCPKYFFSSGTMQAACSILEKAGASIELCIVVIELSDLKGRNKVKPRVESLIQYSD